MKKLNKLNPPDDLLFWDLFDYIWANGIGNELHRDGSATPWTATSLESRLDGSPDKRTIDNWRRRSSLPSPEGLRKLSWVIAGSDQKLRSKWHKALLETRLKEERARKAKKVIQPQDLTNDTTKTETPLKVKGKFGLIGGLGLFCVIAAYWFYDTQSSPRIDNIRICDAPYFNQETKKCDQHVSVFVQPADEVFLSFNFVNVPDKMPFERWWIHNGERVAGRTSFNDEAWPGYTFWRPQGGLNVGQYVVRLVVDGSVQTQTFFVQPEGFTE